MALMANPRVCVASMGEISKEIAKKTGWLDDKQNKVSQSVSRFVDKASNFFIKNNNKNTKLQQLKDVRGLWDVCDSCGTMLYTLSDDYAANKRICHGCGHHLRCGSTDRIEQLLDPATWIPLDEDMVAKDALGFFDEDYYGSRVAQYRKRSGLTDAVQTGIGKIHGTKVALGVMDFRFMGGSMGSVVGEKITRLVEHATENSLPLIIVCSSGGARMQEGTLSLMQMAKVSAALHTHQQEKGLLYIPILTNPTTGGITASFGMLGDIILAEPKAYIAFAGKRVIQQTLKKQLPDDFQTAEYVFGHGLVDLIVPGSLLRSCLHEIFDLYACAPCKKVPSAA